MLQASSNPNIMIQQMANQNPIMRRAIGMAQGKSPEQLRDIATNLCAQKGMSPEETRNLFGQFGL